MSTFVFDPNNVRAFVEEWMRQVGLLHLNEKYNGFAFFNEQRELLDVYVPDIDGEWIDVSVDLSDTYTGWDALADRAKACGAVNIVGVHNHLPDAPDEVCNDLPEMVAAACAEMEVRGLAFRGTAMTKNGELEGFMFAKKVPRSRADQILARPIGYPDDLPSPREILEQVRLLASAGEGVAMRLLPLMEKIVGDIESGEDTDPELIREAMRLAIEGLSESFTEQDFDTPTSGIDLSDLMPYTPDTKGLLN